KPLTIAAKGQGKLYGDAVAFAGTEFVARGVEKDDAVISVTLTSDGAAAVATVDEYDIDVSDAQGTGLANYDITYVKGALVVEKRSEERRAGKEGKLHGETDAYESTEC